MRLMRIWGVQLTLNPFFLALLALFFVAGVLDRGLIAFGVVLIHEAAHIAVARRLGLSVTEAELLPFGGVARADAALAAEPRREILVALAGPASNFIMLALGLAAKNHGLWHPELGPFFLQCNLLVGIINLLPALPLDGGRVARAFLATRLGGRQATWYMANGGLLLGFGLALLGIIGISAGVCGLDIPVVAAFLFYAALKERRAAPYLWAQLVLHKQQNQLLRTGVLSAAAWTALEDTPVGQMTNLLLPGRFNLVAVLDQHMQYKGLVTESLIIETLLSTGAHTPVGDLLPK